MSESYFERFVRFAHIEWSFKKPVNQDMPVEVPGRIVPIRSQQLRFIDFEYPCRPVKLFEALGDIHGDVFYDLVVCEPRDDTGDCPWNISLIIEESYADAFLIAIS